MAYDRSDKRWQKPQPRRTKECPELGPLAHVKDSVEFLLEKAAFRNRKARMEP